MNPIPGTKHGTFPSAGNQQQLLFRHSSMVVTSFPHDILMTSGAHRLRGNYRLKIVTWVAM